MQREYRLIDPFPEIIESDQGSISNNTGMRQRSSLNNFLNPVENRVWNYSASYDESSCVNAGSYVQTFSQWDSGESSSRPNFQNNQFTDDGPKMEERWVSSASARLSLGPRPEERQFEPSHNFFPGRAPSFSHGSSSNNSSPNLGYFGGSSNGRSLLDVGPSGSSGYLTEETAGSSGGWGSSCKRKVLEGSSGHSYLGGSSGCFPPQPENATWQTGSTHHNASSSLSLSPPTRISPSELQHTRNGQGMRGEAFNSFPSSSVARDADSVRNSSSRRFNTGYQQEPLAFNLSTVGLRRSSAWSMPPTNANTSQVPAHGILTYGSSRAGNLSGSFIPRERFSAFRDESNSRSISEMRHMGQDPSGWSLATGNPSSSFGISSTRTSSSSSIRSLPTPAWFPHQYFPQPTNQQRFSEFAPWPSFPSMDSESGGQSGHFPPLSSGSSQETMMNSGGQGHNQQIPRGAFSVERHGDDVLGISRSLRALAADIEDRHRYIYEICQALNAMRRGENLPIEDYMFLDPYMHHGIAEMHDTHRDMRLDVDNMSYEELLALEERIGNVSTGLPEGTILKLMKQTKYLSMTTRSCVDVEPCSICQEEYINGDELGKLECGHDFHTNCIKHWLMLKNLCPICKTTALPT